MTNCTLRSSWTETLQVQYSHWMGMRTSSAAVKALTVSSTRWRAIDQYCLNPDRDRCNGGTEDVFHVKTRHQLDLGTGQIDCGRDDK